MPHRLVRVVFPHIVGYSRLALDFVRGRHRTFRHVEQSSRRRKLEERWSRSFPGAPATGHLRDLFPERWARFHIRGPHDAAFDIDAAKTLRSLLDELSQERNWKVQMIAQEGGAGDFFSGWSKSVPADFFPWRKSPADEDGPAIYYWASGRISPQAVNHALLKVVAEEGEAVFTDKKVTWAFCPYWAGVDIIFPSSQERDEFVNAHRDLLSRHPSGL